MNIAYLKCSLCGAEYAADKVKYVCPKHCDSGLLDVVYDYDRIFTCFLGAYFRVP